MSCLIQGTSGKHQKKLQTIPWKFLDLDDRLKSIKKISQCIVSDDMFEQDLYDEIERINLIFVFMAVYQGGITVLMN